MRLHLWLTYTKAQKTMTMLAINIQAAVFHNCHSDHRGLILTRIPLLPPKLMWSATDLGFSQTLTGVLRQRQSHSHAYSHSKLTFELIQMQMHLQMQISEYWCWCWYTETDTCNGQDLPADLQELMCLNLWFQILHFQHQLSQLSEYCHHWSTLDSHQCVTMTVTRPPQHLIRLNDSNKWILLREEYNNLSYHIYTDWPFTNLAATEQMMILALILVNMI